MRKHFFLEKQIDLEQLILLALLALVTWAGRFFSLNQFGLYYEDWGRIPVAMAWTWSEWFAYMIQVPQWLISAQYEGRPLHPASIHTLAFLGQRLGGLPALYLIGCGIATLNTWLYYLLLKRVTGAPLFALLGALAFALFPTDNSQILLTISLGVLPALTLVLLAFHLYLTGRKRPVLVSYLLVLISVFYYEKFLLLFCAAPLLKPEWNRRSWVEWLRHCGVLAAMLVGVALLRKLNSEGRVAELQLSSFYNPLLSLVAGPIVTINTFLKQPWHGLLAIQPWDLPPLGFFFLIMACAIYVVAARPSRLLTPQNWLDIPPAMDRAGSIRLRGLQPPHFLRLTLAGCLLLVLAYPLNFLDSPFITEGRISRVHVAAGVGGALLWTCLVFAVVGLVAGLLKIAPRRSWIAVLGSVYFTLLIAFGFTVQQDYWMAAQYQRAFWRQLVALCPDMTKDTVILVQPSVSRDFNFLTPIEPLDTGHFPRILGYFYQFPQEWLAQGKPWSITIMKSRQPKTYLLQNKWRKTLKVQENGLLKLNSKAVEPNRFAGLTVDSTNVILIDSRDNQLVRVDQPLVLNGKSFPLKQNTPPLKHPPFEKGVLHDAFLKP